MDRGRVADVLEVEQVRRLRLAAHGLAPGLGLDPAGVLDRAVALQGQDLLAVLRAIALRSRRDVDEVRGAFDRCELVRGWPMRGTLFATTPGRLAGLLGLTAERTERQMARRRVELWTRRSSSGRARSPPSGSPTGRSAAPRCSTCGGPPASTRRVDPVTT